LPDLDGVRVEEAVGVAAGVVDGVAAGVEVGVRPVVVDGVAAGVVDGVAAAVDEADAAAVADADAAITANGLENSLVNICRPPAAEVAVAVRRLVTTQEPKGMVNAKGVGLVAPVTTRAVPM